MNLIISLILYVYFSICLQTIAKKENIEKGWMAWVPIVNVLLMCRIAAVPKKWFIAFIVMFVLFFITGPVPVLMAVVSIATIIYFVMLWMKIAQKRNKPAWWGILIVLPVVSLFAVGYLAFSDKGSSAVQPSDISSTEDKPTQVL